MAPDAATLLDRAERQAILGLPAPAQGPGPADPGSAAALAAALASGDYEGVLRSRAAQAVFGTGLAGDAEIGDPEVPAPADPGFSASDIRPLVSALVGQYVEANGPEAWLQITLVGAACLSAFAQTNWTGPDFQLDPAALLPRALAERWREAYDTAVPTELAEDSLKHEIGRREQQGRVYLGAAQSEARAALDRALLRMLEADGEEAYALAPRPLYLYLARLLLIDIPDTRGALPARDAAAPSARWWAARALTVQQSILDYPAQTLLDQILGLLAQVRQSLPPSPATAALEKATSADTAALGSEGVADDIEADGESTAAAAASAKSADEETPDGREWDPVPAGDRDLWTRYLVEVGVVYTQHKMALDTKRYFALAQAASGLQWQVTGAKGKRTKFQTFDVAQLVLLAKSARPAGDRGSGGAMPEEMELNSDLLLERVTFSDPDSELANQEDLHPIDKCLLLALCLNVQNENPAHGLTSEQMMPFITRVLDRPGNWSVYTMGLLLRSRLEATKTRTVERATLQVQALVDQITRPLPGADEAGAAERLRYMQALALPSHWALERELAGMFMELGVVRSALDIYERLQMWDDVVSCYTLLGQTEVAERILLRELDAAPDRPKLWCALGDLRRDPELWRKAWDVSGQRFARAMRSLGAHHFARDEFAEAVECYRRAVALNPLLENSWFVLGCAAMKIQDWSVAADAFIHVVSIDQNNGESWNNLATAYLRMGPEHRVRAMHALREAVKYLSDSWRVWSNLVHVGMWLGMFSSVVNALGRIIDLRVAKDGAACVDLDVVRSLIGRLVHGTAIQGLTGDDAARAEQRLAAQVESLLVNRIEARITSSPQLWRAMADFWFWRRDYRHCLDCYVKAYRCVSQHPQVAYAPHVFADAVEAALELVSSYENLGDKTQVVRAADAGDGHADKAAAAEVPVCADWRHQARMVLRGLIGRARESFDGTPGFARLTEALAELRQ
ncbi:hypothetical protein H4R18_005727 [Coemansia javaensis]|uniref:TPR-like protein n=1 Tax=Coemansia javaensis TaxID=2761396 RepID=A0A9W8LED9_9FUNG|nr:hypothetical protein H4R18_005727 [Coemansia javaensis]